jgi:hypothetical protein
MATITAGTALTTTLTALIFQRAGLAAADIATISQLIKNETGQAEEYLTGGKVGGIAGPFHSFSQNGHLVIPNRGTLRMLPGDLVAVDSTGWPVLLSATSAGPGGSGDWRHTL